MNSSTTNSSSTNSSVSNPRIERVEGTVMPVNSYIVQGPDGLVIVDGQLTVTDARAVRRAADSFGRPIAGLVITHGHPDHYAGAATILDGLSAPIIATQGVADVISSDDAEKDAIVAPMMGDEWPAERRFPDEIVAAGESVAIAGLEFNVHGLGAGESHVDTLWSVDERTIFSGDIAYNDMDAYLLDGHIEEWLQVLAALDREIDQDATLYVGHGAPTGKLVLGRQASYVRAFRDAVDDQLDADETVRHDRVVQVMAAMVSDKRLQFLMELSIEPVAAILREAQ